MLREQPLTNAMSLLRRRARLVPLLFAAAGLTLVRPAFPSAAAETAAPTTEAKSDAVGNSAVKIFATVRYPDPARPWTKQPPAEVTGSGVVIEGKRILSNAHVVLYASQVQVQANQSGDKLPATVEAVAPGIDLAVLKLEDETFFETHPPLPRATVLPEIRDTVMAYGFPTGGNSLSITKGIVSRIEFAMFNFPVSGLRIQIDAAINPGNSGGPVVAGDKMIGVAFSRLGMADNIGFIIPAEEIELFLEDLKDGRYDGKPALFDELQTLENPALRAFLKLDKSVEGMVVHKPRQADPAYPLREWDLITRIGEVPVDVEGSVKLGPALRVRFQYLVQKLAKDGKVPLTLVRGGRELQIQLPVSAKYPVVLPNLDGAYPTYFVYGPLVFSAATAEYLNALGGDDGRGRSLFWNGSPLMRRFMDPPAFDGERLVVVASPFFPHKLTKGYSNPAGQVVRAINGRAIKNLEHLVETLRDLKDEFVTVEFNQRGAEPPSSRAPKCSPPPRTSSATTASAAKARPTRWPSGTPSPRSSRRPAGRAGLPSRLALQVPSNAPS